MQNQDQTLVIALILLFLLAAIGLFELIRKLNGVAATESLPEPEPIPTTSVLLEKDDVVGYIFKDDPDVLRLVYISGDKSDPKNGIISWHSPLGAQLLGLAEGDEKEVQLPGGEKTVKVLLVKKSIHNVVGPIHT